MLVHFEHADPVLAPEDLLQLVVSKNFPLVLRVLQVVLADVIPHLRNDLAARKRIAAANLRAIRRGLNRASQSSPCLTCALCHHGPPVVPLFLERNSGGCARALRQPESAFARG